MKRRIAISTPVHAPAEVVAGILAVDPCAAFAPHTPGPARRQPAVASSLTVDLPAGASAVKRVELTLGGREQIEGDSFSFPIQWHAVGPRALFPEFDGRLDVLQPDPAGAAELRLRGFYRPPLRGVGAVFDAVLGHRMARASLQSFLSDAARRLDAEAERRPRRLGA